MIKANIEHLVESYVQGEICHPNVADVSGKVTGAEDRSSVAVIQAGVSLNVRVGDRAFNWVWGERVMPGVTIRNPDRAANAALHMLACIGNQVTVVAAAMDSKDTRVRGQGGTVVGKDPGVGTVTVHFPKRVTEKLVIGDRIQVRAHGQGLAFPGYEGISVQNCSPQLFKAVNPTEKAGRIRVSVTCIIPGKLMAPEPANHVPGMFGCEIQSTSPEVVKEYKLENIRLGDLVAVADFDATRGPRWHNGAITIGAVSHGASSYTGHGVGVDVLFTSAGGLIEPVITRKANIKELLALV